MKHLLETIKDMLNMDIDMRGAPDGPDQVVVVSVSDKLFDDQELAVVMSDYSVYGVSVRRIV